MAVKRDKSSPWEFLWYALYAFAGLGLELVLMGGVEPALFGGTPPSRYTAAHTLLHWGMTMACWGLTAALLVRQAEKKLGFSLLDSTTGGKGGGGAALTPEGARLLRAYDTFCARLHDAADELFQEEFAPFL